MNDDQKLKALQIEFEEILTCIKPFYLNWKVVTEKHFIASWIRKLTNLKCFGIDSMHLRNLYILALFDSVRRDNLPPPFTGSPPNGDLLPLPSHLKEVIDKFSVKPHMHPDWLGDVGTLETRDNLCPNKMVDGDEEEYFGTSKFIHEAEDYKQNPFEVVNQVKSIEFQNNGTTLGENIRFSNLDNNWIRYNPIRNGVQEFRMRDSDTVIIGDNDTFDHLDNYDEVGSKQKTNELSFSNRVQEKEMLLNNITGMERRLAQLQNSYHEDIMKLRSQHDIETQSLILRKGAEMEQLQKDFNEKISEQEYHMDQMEIKANECMKQLQLFQENKLKEIDQMKKNNNENLEEQSRIHEQKVLTLYEDFQKEKKQLIAEHKKKEDALSKETNDYFAKLKSEFAEKASETNKEIINLERDIGELKASKNKIMEENEFVASENQRLTVEIKKLHTELNESQRRYQFIESQHTNLTQNHEQEIRSIKDTLETALHNVQCAKDEIEAKAYDKSSNLEKQVDVLHKNIADLNKSHICELENVLSSYNNEKTRIKEAHDHEIELLKSQISSGKMQYESKLLELERQMEQKKSQINQIEKELQMKDKITTQTIEDLRQEMTLSSERQLRKKQFEFDQIESELKYEIHDKSKEVTDLMQQLSSHKQETEIKLSEIRKWSDSQMSVLTSQWKQEKTSIEREYASKLLKINEDNMNALEIVNKEKERKAAELENEIETLKKLIGNQKSEYEGIMKAYKKQIADLVKSNEDEKERIDFHNQVNVENLNQQLIDLKFNLEKKHAEQVGQILTKTNEKLKEIEYEYGERSLQSFKMINDLKAMVEKLKKEKQDGKSYNDEQLNSLAKKYHSESLNYQRIIKTNQETFKKEISNEQEKYKNFERLQEKKEHNFKRQLTQLKSEFEGKMSKLLPLEVQVDFEETIQSLKSQISFLQQRINILEDEVDMVNIFKSGQSDAYIKSKCDNLFEE